MLLTRKVILLFVLCVAGAWASDNSRAAIPNHVETAAVSSEVLTNEGLITLASAGFSDAFIMQKILLSDRTRFDVSVEGLANLHRNALSESLVLFLVEHTAQPAVTRPSPYMPPITSIAVQAKVKVKKVAVPVVMAADAMNPAVTPLATVANPVVSGHGTYAPNPYGWYGAGYPPFSYFPYGYPMPSTGGVVTVPQVTAMHWWK
jgi:hypothetical protein